ncbi:metallophosphoesterase [Caminicella sporogenes]|uniref:metallophosphoesterase n=1 Tax=Caminicella sporogenes TaxID=166485 RepID=UPI00253FD9AA|nr:metallophosphoesterase [Caminicella sporogenes]WIF95202.1 metallophosphoesterase [Caminicella sporogenes]
MEIKFLNILLITMIILFLYNYYQINFPKVNFVSIKTNKIDKNTKIKILQLSDIHNKKFPNNNKNILKKIKDAHADIIVITGDLIDSKTKNFEYIYSFIKELLKINKNIYYVSGNHEWRSCKFYEISKQLSKMKIKVLNNTSSSFVKNGTSINICGIDDSYSNRDNLDKILNNINKNIFTLLLSHSPNVIKHKNLKMIDLILCGHTHGGQVRFPIIGCIIIPGQGLFPKYDKGIFKINNNTTLYIDSGLGTSSLPIRFLNRSQLSLIIIESK